MISQLNEVLDVIDKELPFVQCLFLFDQSSNHKAMADDALSVTKMNVHPGGCHPMMRPGKWNGKEQAMVDDVGQAKGLLKVLDERGLLGNIPGTGCNGRVVKADLQQALAACDDFKSQQNVLAETITSHRRASLDPLPVPDLNLISTCTCSKCVPLRNPDVKCLQLRCEAHVESPQLQRFVIDDKKRPTLGSIER